MRTFARTDWRWARAARAAAREGIAAHDPRALLYSTTTAALLWPRPGAIRYDAPAAATRPGRHGFWQRPLERSRLRDAPLLVATSQGTLDESPQPLAPSLVVPITVEPSGLGAPWAQRDISAITYAADPHKKGLDRVLAAWDDGAARGRDARRRRPRARAPGDGPGGRARPPACSTATPTARCCCAPSCS